MILNVWTLAVSAALLIATLLFTVWKRPRIPLVTLILIVELTFFLLGLNALNNRLSPTGNSMAGPGVGVDFLVGLLLGSSDTMVNTYEAAFGQLQFVIQFLLIATVIAVLAEAYAVLIRPAREKKNK